LERFKVFALVIPRGRSRCQRLGAKNPLSGMRSRPGPDRLVEEVIALELDDRLGTSPAGSRASIPRASGSLSSPSRPGSTKVLERFKTLR
jgi:hypothetical protein